MGWLDFLTGSKDKLKKVSNFSPEQTGLFNNFLNQTKGLQGGAKQATGLLQDYLNPESDVYQNFEAPYMRNFNEQTVPRLAEQFAGAGATGGALSSSAFGQSLGAAGAGLQENLGSMKSTMQRQAIMDFLGQYNQQNQTGLGAKPFDYINQQGSQGLLGGIAQGVTGNLPGIIQGAMNQYGGRGSGFTASPQSQQMDMGFRSGAPGYWR